MEDKLLFHGSREGIVAPIKPISRTHCDFGKGFYMGTDEMQVKSLVLRGDNPMFYTLKFKLSEIPENRILVLKDEEWLYAVLACRGMSYKFNQLDLAKHWLDKLSRYDVVIGKIADDSMKDAIWTFSTNGITDKGLIACLQTAGLGVQYVAKTDFACSKIEKIAESRLSLEDVKAGQQYSLARSEACSNCIEINADKYYGQGKLLSQIINNEQKKQNRGYER